MKTSRYTYLSILFFFAMMASFLLPQAENRALKITACTTVASPEKECHVQPVHISNSHLKSLDIFLR